MCIIFQTYFNRKVFFLVIIIIIAFAEDLSFSTEICVIELV